MTFIFGWKPRGLSSTQTRTWLTMRTESLAFIFPFLFASILEPSKIIWSAK